MNYFTDKERGRVANYMLRFLHELSAADCSPAAVYVSMKCGVEMLKRDLLEQNHLLQTDIEALDRIVQEQIKEYDKYK